MSHITTEMAASLVNQATTTSGQIDFQALCNAAIAQFLERQNEGLPDPAGEVIDPTYVRFKEQLPYGTKIFTSEQMLATVAARDAEINNLHTVMMAAAVEINEHWGAHCDEEGYGPENLVRRLETGYPEQYGYDSQTVVRMEKRIVELETSLKESREMYDEAMVASNEAGFSGMSAAETIKELDAERGLLSNSQGVLIANIEKVAAARDAALAEVQILHLVNADHTVKRSAYVNEIDELKSERDAALAALHKLEVSLNPSGFALAAIGREHFGNPIPQEWYSAARGLLNSMIADMPLKAKEECEPAMPDDELPGMWSNSDSSGGATDCCQERPKG